MTISQVRLHAVCEAGKRILDAYEEKLSKANDLFALIRRGGYDEGRVLAHLHSLASPNPLLPLDAAKTTLAYEAGQYDRTAKRNARAQLHRMRHEGKPIPQPPTPLAIQPNIREVIEIDQLIEGLPVPTEPPLRRFTEAENAEIEAASRLQRLEDQVRGLEAHGLDSEMTLQMAGYEWNETHTRLIKRTKATTQVESSFGPGEDDENWGEEQ